MLFRSQVDIEKLKKICNEKILIPIETSIKNFNLLGIDIKLPKHKIYMKNSKINSIEKKENKYFINVTTNNAKFKILK